LKGGWEADHCAGHCAGCWGGSGGIEVMAVTAPHMCGQAAATTAFMTGGGPSRAARFHPGAAAVRVCGRWRSSLISLGRTGVRLNARHLAELRSAIEELIEAAREHPDDDGVWTTVLWTVVDREDRHIGKE